MSPDFIANEIRYFRQAARQELQYIRCSDWRQRQLAEYNLWQFNEALLYYLNLWKEMHEQK